MRCPNCGVENRVGARYCKQCGVQLPGAGRENRPARPRGGGKKRPWTLMAAALVIVIAALGVVTVAKRLSPGISGSIVEEEGVVIRALEGEPLPARIEVKRAPPPEVAPQGLSALEAFDIAAEGEGSAIVAFPLPEGAEPDRVVVGHFVDGEWQYQPGVIAGDRVVIVATSFSEYGLFQVEPEGSPSTVTVEEGEGVEGEACPRASGEREDWEWRVEGERCWTNVALEEVQPREDILQADVILHNNLRIPIAVRPESDGAVSWGEFRGFAKEDDPGKGFYLPPQGEAHFEDVLLWGPENEWRFRVLVYEEDDPWPLTAYMLIDVCWLGMFGEHMPDSVGEMVFAGATEIVEPLGMFEESAEIAEAMAELVRWPSVGSAWLVANRVVNSMIEYEDERFRLTPFGEAVLEVMAKIGEERVKEAIEQHMTGIGWVLEFVKWGRRLEEEVLMAYDFLRTGVNDDEVRVSVCRLEPAPSAGTGLQPVRLGRGWATDLAYSPDGRSLAVASPFGIYLYEAASLEDIRYIETDSRVTSIAFSPDGALLAAGEEEGAIRLWRTADGGLATTLSPGGHTGAIRDVSFSPDGAWLASGTDEGTIQLWSVRDAAIGSVLDVGRDETIESIAFSPDGRSLLAGTASKDPHPIGNAYLWRVEDGQLRWTREACFSGMGKVDFSPSGDTVVLSCGSGEVQVCDASHGEVKAEFDCQWGCNAVFSPSGDMLASGSFAGTVLLWNVSEGEFYQALHGHTGGVTSVAFSPDGSRLASISSDGTVRIWRVNEGSVESTQEEHLGGIHDVAFSGDEARVVAGGAHGAVRIWETAGGNLVSSVNERVSDEGTQSTLLSPDGSLAASTSMNSLDNRVWLWRTTDGEVRSVLVSEEGPAPRAFSPDGKTLAVALWGGTVELWDVEGSRLLRTLETHRDRILSMAFSPDGEWIALGADEGTVQLWRVSYGGLVSVLEGHTDVVSTLDFAPDGSLLASGGRDGTVRLWRLPSGDPVDVLDVRETPDDRVWVSSVDFSPGGALLAIGAGTYEGKGILQIRRVTDGGLLHTLEAHRGWVSEVVFSPSGRLLASGADDGVVFLWRMEGAESRESVSVTPTPTPAVSSPVLPEGYYQVWTTHCEERGSDGQVRNQADCRTTVREIERVSESTISVEIVEDCSGSREVCTCDIYTGECEPGGCALDIPGYGFEEREDTVTLMEQEVKVIMYSSLGGSGYYYEYRHPIFRFSLLGGEEVLSGGADENGVIWSAICRWEVVDTNLPLIPAVVPGPTPTPGR